MSALGEMGSVKIGAETPAFGGSSNSGFWLAGRKCFIFQWGLTDALSARLAEAIGLANDRTSARIYHNKTISLEERDHGQSAL
jgi:hypothetical protein